MFSFRKEKLKKAVSPKEGKMLKLIDVKKDYYTAGQTVHALKGVNLCFRKNEFVSILGASGCGKTTLLNIIGGLDHYTSGDLIVNGKSTKEYKDKDWDVYRNHRIGFVFQSYNLIPHQTVLGNVEIALTIAGVSKAERRKRAEEALIRVGLGAEMKKRPNQLSGGQMQRVAIARALVNNPEILLADEPTGALDTETSVQIMDLIREIAGERLVIMVTHNPELAEEYSSRIVRLQDGLVLSDSNPYEGDDAPEEETAIPDKPKKEKKERSSMSFGTSLGLSAKNLAMKKGRTIITSIAGSIGIISVCLVLALSNGFNNYIKKTQEDMLSSAPLTISENTMDITAIMSGMSSASEMPDLSELDNQVYVNSFLTNMAKGMTVKNDISDEYVSYLREMDESWYETIAFDTGMELSDALYTDVMMMNQAGTDEKKTMSLSALKNTYKMQLQASPYGDLVDMVELLGSIYGKMPGTSDVNDESFGKYVLSQYDEIKGTFPKNANEVALVIGSNNDITDLTMVQLGMIPQSKFMGLLDVNKEQEALRYSFDDIVGKQYTLYDNSALYSEIAEGEADYENYLYKKVDGTKPLSAEGRTLTISCILRLKEGMNYGCLGNGGLFLTEQLYNELLARNMQAPIAQDMRVQLEKSAGIIDLFAKLTAEPSQALMQEMNDLIEQNKSYLGKRIEKSADEMTSKTYMSGASMGQPNLWVASGDAYLRKIGGLDSYNSIKVYTDTFENKEHILTYLDDWNDLHKEDTAKQVKYTDTIGMMMSMVEMMLNAITYVLVAFTAISLVVSSVMIGIITYVSVVERVKEIGVLRSLGASKGDIKNLFNAETFIIGLSSGVFGVAVTYLLSLGINALLGSLTGIATLASLPFSSALIMVGISIVLTLISGLIPANAAAKKDPVVALRTE